MKPLQIETNIGRGDITNPHPWYAIRTRPKHEKTAYAMLISKGFQPYFPTYVAQRRWSDRVVKSKLAVFPGYLFCRIDQQCRVPVVTIPSVLSILSYGKVPVPIPDHEIEAIDRVLRSGLLSETFPLLREGQRISIRSGPLAGLEGILLKKKDNHRLVISVSLLQRSLAVEVDSHSIANL